MKFGTNSGIFLPFSAVFGHFLWESRDILSFSENIREILIKFHQNFAEKWPNSLTKVGMKFHFISFHFIPAKKFDGFLLEFWGVSGAKAKKSCRARKMLKNKATLAIVAVDTGENEPLKVWGVSFHYFNRILIAKPSESAFSNQTSLQADRLVVEHVVLAQFAASARERIQAAAEAGAAAPSFKSRPLEIVPCCSPAFITNVVI